MSNNQHQLKDYIKQIRGISYKPHQVLEQPKEGYIALLRATNIIDGKLDLENVLYVDETLVKEAQILQEGDILIAASSGSLSAIGKSAAFKGNGKYTFGAFCKVVRPININQQYLEHYFGTTSFKNTIQNQINGANIKNIKNEHLDDLKLSIPKLETQQRIVDVLNTSKELILKRQSQITALDELKQSLFLEIFGDLRLNPFNWEYKKLEQLYEIIDGDRGKNYPKQHDFFEDEYCLFLNTGNVTSKGFNFSKTAFITKEKDESLRKGKMKKDDIVVTTRGTVGNIAYFDEHVPYEQIRINSGMVILRSKVEINPIFFMNYFRNPVVYKNLISGTAQPQMPINNMKNALLYYPPIEIQNSYAEKIERINHKSRLLEKALVEYEILYESILNKAFKGELFQD